MTTLSWSKPAALAALLAEAYPGVDRLALDLRDIPVLLSRLPQAATLGAAPDDLALSQVRWLWMRYADEGVPANTDLPPPQFITEKGA
jgi:hypothetical protein